MDDASTIDSGRAFHSLTMTPAGGGWTKNRRGYKNDGWRRLIDPVGGLWRRLKGLGLYAQL